MTKPYSCKGCNYSEYYLYHTGEDYDCIKECMPLDKDPWYKNVIIEEEERQ